MSRVRVLFELSMPGKASWDGKWTGEGRAYNCVRHISSIRAEELKIPHSWPHTWSDGWAARVSARVLEKGERRPKSAGFCGYEWMVDNIIDHGTTYEAGESR